MNRKDRAASWSACEQPHLPDALLLDQIVSFVDDNYVTTAQMSIKQALS